MTGPGSVGDAMSRFSDEVGEILTHVSRVTAAAAEVGADFRAQTDHLAEQARTGEARPTEVDLTDERLREAATGFRTDNGLPVEDLPSGRELLDHGDPTDPDPTTEGTDDVPRSSDPKPRPDDDDEDFSQARIMRLR